METKQDSLARRPGVSALETSLVEWKRHADVLRYGQGGHLGNFLSGMETGLQVLGGRAGDDLGNFLSGMETVPRIGRLLRPFMRLGNFLSGMETIYTVMNCRVDLSPWKLP